MRNENGVDFRLTWVKLVDSRDLRKDSKFLKAFFALGRKKRRRIKLFPHSKRHAEIKKYPHVSVLKQDFVSADLVDAAVERQCSCVLDHVFSYLSASIFLQEFDIASIMDGSVKMLKTLVYLGVPAFLMVSMSPPAFR